MYNCGITATSASLPVQKITNDHFNNIGSSAEWIAKRTGIISRNWVGIDSLLDHAVSVAKDLLSSTESDIDGIIIASCTPAKCLPNMAHLVAAELGFQGFLLDVNVACCGFVYALNVAHALIRSGQYQNLMVIGADAMSQVVDKKDRATAVLFGDGAAGVVLSKTDSIGVIDFKFTSATDKIDLITDEGSWLAGIAPVISMKGPEVFKLAVRSQVAIIQSMLDQHDCAVDDIDYFLFHQANMRIIRAVMSALDIKDAQVPMNIEVVGNTSSASIPLVLNQVRRAQLLRKDMVLMGCAVGAGMSTGAFLLNWNE